MCTIYLRRFIFSFLVSSSAKNCNHIPGYNFRELCNASKMSSRREIMLNMVKTQCGNAFSTNDAASCFIRLQRTPTDEDSDKSSLTPVSNRLLLTSFYCFLFPFVFK